VAALYEPNVLDRNAPSLRKCRLRPHFRAAKFCDTSTKVVHGASRVWSRPHTAPYKRALLGKLKPSLNVLIIERNASTLRADCGCAGARAGAQKTERGVDLSQRVFRSVEEKNGLVTARVYVKDGDDVQIVASCAWRDGYHAELLLTLISPLVDRAGQKEGRQPDADRDADPGRGSGPCA
jgi:hypothetical protein